MRQYLLPNTHNQKQRGNHEEFGVANLKKGAQRDDQPKKAEPIEDAR